MKFRDLTPGDWVVIYLDYKKVHAIVKDKNLDGITFLIGRIIKKEKFIPTPSLKNMASPLYKGKAKPRKYLKFLYKYERNPFYTTPGR